MLLYKCEECGFMTSEKLGECPKCHSERNPISINALDLKETVFVLVEEDVNEVIESMSEEEQKKIREHSDEVIMDILSRKLEIPWYEYIEGCLSARFC